MVLLIDTMSRSPLRWALTTAAIGTLIATTGPAHADGPGTPSQPPPDLPPPQPQQQQMQPPQSPQAQQPQSSPQQVPAYRTYQQRRIKKSQWYGWQTLIVDGSWIVGGPLLASVSAESGAALILGGYFLGPPIVHWAHGQVGRGFADLGIRVGAPVVLGTVGYLVFTGGGSNGSYDALAGAVGILLGAGLGIVAAIVVDAAALAYEPADDDDDEAVRRSPRRNALLPATIVPMFAPRTEGGAVLGVSGTLY